MMFGNFGFLSGLMFNNMKLTSVEVEKKLDNPDTTLEDLLVEEELIQELKNQNPKLLKFFSKDRIKSLVNYIIIEPTEDDQLKGHKFPFVSSELLNCNDQNISDYFLMTNSELYSKKENEKMNHEKNTSKDFSSKGINDILNELNKKEDEEEIKKEENKNEEENKKEENKKEEEIKNEEEIKKEETKNNEELKNDYPENRIELLDHLLSFVETESELNYVLAGYFSKFLIILFNKKPLTLINYFFKERKDILEKFIYHSYRKSISDLLSKFLLFENYIPENDSNSEDKNILHKIRLELIENIFSNLKITEEREKISSIVLMLIDIFETKPILNEIMDNDKIYSPLFQNLKIDLNSDENINNLQLKSNYSEILSLLTYMISNSDNCKKPKLDSNDNKKIIHSNLSENILNYFDTFIDNYNQKEESISKIEPIPTVFNESEIKPLGTFRVKIVEFFSSLFPYLLDISQIYDNLLIKSNFFQTSFNYLFKYEWNNIFQTSLLMLFKNYLKDANYHIELSSYLFEQFNIINLIKNNILNNEKDKFVFNSNNKITHGYFPFLISLSYKINSVIGGNPLSIFTRSREGSITFINRSEINDFFNKYRSGFGFGSDINVNNDNKDSKNISSNKNTICESMRKYVNEEWNEFFKNNVSDIVRLYENKLCDKNNLESEFENQEKEDNKNESPFNKEVENFFNDIDNKNNDNNTDNNNNNNDNWFFNDEKDNNQNYAPVDINDFEFEDEVKSSEKVEDIQNSTGKLVVDEIDNNQYNDANFFKVPFNEEELNSALKELEK